MEWDKVEIVIPIEVGEITDKKRDIISQIFKDKAEVDDNNDVILIKNLNEPEIIIIDNESIAYINFIGHIVETGLLGEIETVANRLLLKDENDVQIKITLITENNQSMNQSKEIFNLNYGGILNDFPNISGVGYRFLIESKKGEIRIEPYVKEENKLFIEYIMKENYNIGNLEEYIGSSMDKMNNIYKGLSKKIF